VLYFAIELLLDGAQLLGAESAEVDCGVLVSSGFGCLGATGPWWGWVKKLTCLSLLLTAGHF
jgi:hypothetical protein